MGQRSDIREDGREHRLQDKHTEAEIDRADIRVAETEWRLSPDSIPRSISCWGNVYVGVVCEKSCEDMQQHVLIVKNGVLVTQQA